MISLENSNIVQIEDYFKAIKQSIKFEDPPSILEQQDLQTSRHCNFDNSLSHHSSQNDEDKYESPSLISQDLDSSVLSNTYPSTDINMTKQNLCFESFKQQTHKLILSKPKIELSLLYTQVAEESIKIMNKNQFKLSLKIRLRDEMKGITILSPSAIDRLSHETISVSIYEIQELGDIFNGIIIQASSEHSFEALEIPFIIRYQRPRLRLEYQGSTCFLNINNNRYPNITLKSSTFEEYMLEITSSHKVDLLLETPMTKSTVFPDELMVSNERRKIAIRSKNKEFCLVAKVKNTQLAFVCKFTVVD